MIEEEPLFPPLELEPTADVETEQVEEETVPLDIDSQRRLRQQTRPKRARIL